ncbi:hypothetical protein [Pseudomonas sp. YL-218 TE3947]|uniref:hypothetical protein n=1 Tax=Pseudomonas TaxID=286 RepID=UPI003D1EA8C0
MTIQDTPVIEITVTSARTVEELMKEIGPVIQYEVNKAALQNITIAHGMGGDIRVIKGEITNLVVGDAA